MKEGSIEEVTERLKLWCSRRDSGLARVEWDSVYSRQEVVSRLKLAGIPVIEIDLPAGAVSHEAVAGIMETLGSLDAQVASITGIEWAFPKEGTRLDTLRALSFQRERLATLPVQQVWWIPTHMTSDFVLGVPDLDSWFRLRLRLAEMPEQGKDLTRFWNFSGPDPDELAEARSLERRFWDRLENARTQRVPEERLWAELAEPAIDALLSAGLGVDADTIMARFPNGVEVIQRKLE